MHRLRAPRAAAVAISLAVVAVMVCLATLGLELPTSPFAAFDLVGPVVADSNGARTAIVDSGSRRVLILNKDHRLMGIIDCGELNSPIEAVTDVCVAEDTIYVTGAKYQADSDIIVRERVIAYNSFGTLKKVLYDRKINDGLTPTMLSMDPTRDGVCVAMMDYESELPGESAIKVVFVNEDTTRVVRRLRVEPYAIHDAGYCVDKDALHTISNLGVLDGDVSSATDDDFVASHLFTSIDTSDEGEVYLCDDVTDSVCRLTGQNEVEPVVRGAGYTNPRVTGDTLTVCNIDTNTVVICGLDGQDRTEIGAVFPSKSLGAVVLVTYACRVYVAVFALAALVLKTKSLLVQGKVGSIGPLFASAVVVGVVSLAIGYTSYGSYKSMQQTRAREIDMLADYVRYSAASICEDMAFFDDRGVLKSSDNAYADVHERLLQIQVQVNSMSYAATQNGIGIYTAAYGRDDQGVYYLLDSSYEHVAGSSLAVSDHEAAVLQAFAGADADGAMHTGATRYDATQYRLVGVLSEDGTRVVGVIEVGSRVRSFEASLAGEQLQRVIGVLVLLLVVYLTYVEVRECAVCFISYQQMRHHHDSIAILTRPFSFLVTLLSSIDAVMTALIARSLLVTSGAGGSSLMFALPAVMMGVGLAVGQGVYAALGSRVVINKLMRRGALAMMVAAVATGAVVWYGSFWMYCVAKLFMAVPFGLLYTLSFSLPRRADTDEVQALAAGGIKRTDTSAAALGTVLGGYVAQSLGNAWVYALVAIVSVVVFLMAANVLPATKHPLEKETEVVESRGQAMWMLLTSKTTLPIIFFVMLPGILATGYNSFVFPLFSADLGLETSSINNLFVLGQLVVFVSIPALEWAEERFDKWRVAGVAVALIGIVFLLFSYNTSLVWSVVTIALVGMLCKASDGWKALWPRSAEASGLPAGMATGMMFSVRSVLLIVQPLLLGALLSEGNRTAVIVLGVGCSLCALAFWLTTRRSALSPTD